MAEETFKQMKIISRYIAGKFWGPFVFIMCIFAVLIFLGDSIEKLRWMTTYSAPFRMVLKYSLLTMPSWLLQILPVACLLSALLVISDMIGAGEWTACLAGGFTVRQIFKPLILCIALVSILGFAAQEFLVPDMSKKAQIILQRKIRKKNNWQANVQNDVTLRLDDKRVLFAKTVRADAGEMRGMFIDIYDDNWAIIRQINARSFKWDDTKKIWIFENGFVREFGKAASVEEKPFKKLESDFSIPPGQIALGGADPYALSLYDIFRRIKFLNSSGLSAFAEYTFLNSKLSAPFAAVIMCLLGMPLATALKRSSKTLNIISAVTIGFFFWWIVSMMTSAGESGMISPVLAGWLPVILFALIAFIEFKILKI
jgi:lipopolysaccharide export system permease protein